MKYHGLHIDFEGLAALILAISSCLASFKAGFHITKKGKKR